MNQMSKKDTEELIRLINKEIASASHLQRLLNKLKMMKETL